MLDGADEDIGQSAKALGEQSQGDALPVPGIAGKHGEATVGDAELERRTKLSTAGVVKSASGGTSGSERMKLQSVEREQFAHGSSDVIVGVVFGRKAGGNPVAA